MITKRRFNYITDIYFFSLNENAFTVAISKHLLVIQVSSFKTCATMYANIANKIMSEYRLNRVSHFIFILKNSKEQCLENILCR